MIDSRMDIDMIVAVTRLASLLLVFSSDVLLVIRQGDVEIEGFVSLVEAQADEGVLASAVLDFQHEVAGGVEDGLHGGLALAREDEAGGEELAGVRILETDLAAVLAGDDAEAARPDLVGLQPLAALVAAGGGPRRDFVDGHFADHKQRVLERFLVVVRHRLPRFDPSAR